MEEINKQKDTSTIRVGVESSSSTNSENSVKDLWRKKMNLLALLLSFEKYWSPYSLSDGSLYKEEAKEEAGKIVSLFKDLYGIEFFERSDNGDILKPSEKMEQKLFVRSLASWLSTEELFPNFAQRNFTVNRNRNYFQNVLAEFENDLVDELGLPIKIKCATSSNED